MCVKVTNLLKTAALPVTRSHVGLVYVWTAGGINKEIEVNGQKLETVTSFKYLGSVITDEGSKPETLSRIAQTTAALTRLKQFGLTRVFLSAPRYN